MAQKWIPADDLDYDNPKGDFVLNRMQRFLLEEQENGWRSALFELDDGVSLERLINTMDDQAGFAKFFEMPNLYRQMIPLKIERKYFTALIRPEALTDPDFRQAFSARMVKLGTFVDAHTFNPEIQIATMPQTINVDEGAVIMAVIDNGVAFGESHFRTGTSSQVEHCWLMDARQTGGVNLGRTLEKSEIDQLLIDHVNGGRLDHMAFYQAAGLVDHQRPRFKPVVQRISHGTHVMSLAAGKPAQAGSRPIICVELPTGTTADPGNTGLEADINLALDHVLLHAVRFKSPDDSRPPLVINLSYGDYAGPHDGSGFIENAIAEKLAVERAAGHATRVVLPAGNGNLARCHARMKFPHAVSDHTLKWRVQPDDHTMNSIEIRTPARPQADITGLIEVQVTTPSGATSPVVGNVENQGYFLVEDGHILALLIFTIPTPKERGLAAFYTVPTASLRDARPLLPHGVWKLTVIRDEKMANDEAAHAWVERGETLPGFPRRGRQSYLEDSHYKRFNPKGAPEINDAVSAIVRRSHTLSGFATNADEDVIVLGAYNARTGRMSDYSASGPSLTRLGAVNPVVAGPDAAAVADDSLVLTGIFGAGSWDGSIVRLSGTSVAVPSVAWLVANELQNATGNDKRQHIHAKATFDDSILGPLPPDPARRGGGRLKRQRRIGSRV